MSGLLFVLRAVNVVEPATGWGYTPGAYLRDVLSAFAPCVLVEAQFYGSREAADAARVAANARIQGLSTEIVPFMEVPKFRRPPPLEPLEERRQGARRLRPIVYPANGPTPPSRRVGRERR